MIRLRNVLVARALAPSALAIIVFCGVTLGAEPPKDTTWWSLLPLVRPAVPQEGGGNPIDGFIRAKLKTKDLSSSPEADRRTLIRRLCFDLIGLPPTPEEVFSFEISSDPQAYELIVDRLLDSPQYGERWARHWLDVVHYGETHGYDKDQPRPNAWPYRDYAIRAFNDDKPYSRFVQEQIAGDVLFPNSPEGIEALGFLAAGPWDLIGHAEVSESKIDGKIARHLDRDDMVANTINTFNSMTVHCAQCHNHKFDPISSEDYYSLHAVFAAIDRTNYEYYQDPLLTRKRNELKTEERELAQRQATLEKGIADAGGAEWAELKKKIESLSKSTDRSHPPEYGYHSAIEQNSDSGKWVQVDLGRSEPISRIVLAPCWDDFGGIGAGFGFPRRFKIEISDEPEFGTAILIFERTNSDFQNPGLDPQTYSAGASGRYVRVTATKLAPRLNDYIFALAELEVWSGQGTNLARNAAVTSLDSIENPVRWSMKNLVDGIYSKNTNDASNVADLQKAFAALTEAKIPENLRADWQMVTNQISEIQRGLASMPRPSLAFVGAVHHGSGTFRGTGPDGGKPRPIFTLVRGDVRKPGKPAIPGALSAIDSVPSRFEVPESASEGERRKALALWLTHRNNPLTWRSIVNRVWQYHFGRGIVDTPNDFGRMGGVPSHPELLDWLATEFRDNGQSFKKLHKLIVMSATYRQRSQTGAENTLAESIDQDNRLLWRMNRRKLEAEVIRDSVLFVSGQLQTQMFGPSFQDFVVEKPEHSPHYRYELFDPENPQSHRRSIYRFIVRSQQQPFMTALDCADPSMLVDKRNESLSALQALALLNDGFMVTMARHFAHSLAKQSGTLESQVEKAVSTALSRPPTDTERREMLTFAETHGLPNLCRLLFNLNEFAFVD